MEYFDPRTIITKKQLKGEGKDIFKSIISDLTNKIPKDVADRILQENNDPDYTILIHRDARRTTEVFFENGLIIAGGNELEYTTNRYNDLTMMISLKDASGYKNPEGKDSRVIVMKIPNSALQYEPGITKPILYQTEDIAEQGGETAIVKDRYQTVLLPEYILGSIEYKNGRIQEFVENPNYREIHDYENNGLVCPSETLDSYMKYYNIDCLGKDYSKLEEEANTNIILENNEYMRNPKKFEVPKRTQESLKEFSLGCLTMEKFKQIVSGFGRIFTQDKKMEGKDGQSR